MRIHRGWALVHPPYHGLRLVTGLLHLQVLDRLSTYLPEEQRSREALHVCGRVLVAV